LSALAPIIDITINPAPGQAEQRIGQAVACEPARIEWGGKQSRKAGFWD